MNEHLPDGSPAHWLQPGEFQVWCPRVYGRPIDRCGFTAPVCAVSGFAAEMGCDRCGGPLRIAEVSLDGARTDKPIVKKADEGSALSDAPQDRKGGQCHDG
jgi:hypothetical protein